MTFGELSAWARARLGGDADAFIDAEGLLKCAAQLDSAALIARRDSRAAACVRAKFIELVQRRMRGVPLAHLIGRCEFWSLGLMVTPDVLIPRADTELLVEVAVAYLCGDDDSNDDSESNGSKISKQNKKSNLSNLSNDSDGNIESNHSRHSHRSHQSRNSDSSHNNLNPRVLELGTGSGAIAIALARECRGCRITATDVCARALAVAKQNGASHRAAIEWICGDWFAPLGARRFELIVSNPPYVAADDAHLRRGDLRFEPPHALIAERRGLAALAHIIGHAARFLTDGGMLLVEHGAQQGEAVRELFARHRFAAIQTHLDLAHRARATCGRRLRAG